MYCTASILIKQQTVYKQQVQGVLYTQFTQVFKSQTIDICHACAPPCAVLVEAMNDVMVG